MISTAHILWINAGGTLVSKRYADPYSPPENVETLPIREADALIQRLLKKLCKEHEVACYNYGIHWEHEDDDDTFLRDSKRYSDEYIDDLAQVIAGTEQKKFLITHGTDRMAENAERLQASLKKKGITDKKIIFAGAMVPLSMQDLHEGDAERNISYAIGELHEGELPAGVYVVGRDAATGRIACKEPSRVTKDMEASRKDLQFTLKAAKAGL